MKNLNSSLERFGFQFRKSSVHTARTMMLDDLCLLLNYVSEPQTSRKEYLKAIKKDNCLGKRSVQTRKLSAAHLANLYALDPSLVIFRALRYFWSREEKGQPLLALLCAYARDTLLRMSAAMILKQPQEAMISRTAMEAFIEHLNPGRFSKATLKSTAQNINATWTSSGHLQGRSPKIRIKVQPTLGAVSYALLLGYLNGCRGESILKSEYVRLLDCTEECALDLATEASRRGWLMFKRIGTVMEVTFPNLLTAEEQRWVYEQN
jgi:hypothetical protein